jgi:hypothetical protein
MVEADEHSVFASLYRASNIDEILDDNQGLIAQYEKYCLEK